MPATDHDHDHMVSDVVPAGDAGLPAVAMPQFAAAVALSALAWAPDAGQDFNWSPSECVGATS